MSHKKPKKPKNHINIGGKMKDPKDTRDLRGPRGDEEDRGEENLLDEAGGTRETANPEEDMRIRTMMVRILQEEGKVTRLVPKTERKKPTVNWIVIGLLMLTGIFFSQLQVLLVNAFTSKKSATEWEFGGYNPFISPDNLLVYIIHIVLIMAVMYAGIILLSYNRKPTKEDDYPLNQCLKIIGLGWIVIPIALPVLLDFVGLYNLGLDDPIYVKETRVHPSIALANLLADWFPGSNLAVWWLGKAIAANLITSTLIGLVTVEYYAHLPKIAKAWFFKKDEDATPKEKHARALERTDR